MQWTFHFSARDANQTAAGFVSLQRGVGLDAAVVKVMSDNSAGSSGSTGSCGSAPAREFAARDPQAEDGIVRPSLGAGGFGRDSSQVGRRRDACTVEPVEDRTTGSDSLDGAAWRCRPSPLLSRFHPFRQGATAGLSSNMALRWMRL